MEKSSVLTAFARQHGAFAIVAFLLLALLPLPASAAETIRRFETEIVVETDGAVGITELIAVSVEGDRIERGIFRDIPVGSSGRAGFDAIEVLRNGEREPYSVESIPDGVRIRIGDPDVFLERSVQIYTIRYRMADQVGYSPDYDEIYWNATGNGWPFPIEQARAIVILPPHATVISAAGYTGPVASTEQKVAIRQETDRVVAFSTMRPLGPNEGMTVAVSFPKGIVAEPSVTDRVLRGLYGESLLIGLGGLLLIFVYYMIAWMRVGQDPPSGPIVARWESDLPPAAMRFLDRMKFDSMTFTTAIVSMAAKGWLAIEENDKEYTLRRRDDIPENAREKLSQGEQKVLSRLFIGAEKMFHVKQSNRSVLQKAQAALKSHFQTTYDKKFFRKNRTWFVPGILLTILLWLVVAWKSAQPELALFMSFWLSGWTFGCLLLVWKALTLWRDVVAGRGWGNLAGAILMSLFAVPFLGGWLFGAGAQVEAIGYVGLAILVLAIAVNVVFFKLLEARTPLGRSVADEIDGMRRYLTVAEKDRLAFHHPPERTPEHFEKLLPYAIALGVEDEWAKQFSDVFARLTEEKRTYHPNWYHGDRFQPGSMGGLGRGLGSSLAAASVSPSSSGGRTGGSFGGGSSGGGGGGGGGGW